MKNRVITISRELGRGGRTVCKRLRKSQASHAILLELFGK